MFSGYEWYVKNSNGVLWGPGPNLWNDSVQNVWVDSNGSLHLRITHGLCLDQWFCAEVYSVQSFGYGTYNFTLSPGFESIDCGANKNVKYRLIQKLIYRLAKLCKTLQMNLDLDECDDAWVDINIFSTIDEMRSLLRHEVFKEPSEEEIKELAKTLKEYKSEKSKTPLARSRERTSAR